MAKPFMGRELLRYNSNNRIKWRFNIPKVPWWGGMFEKMVRSTRRCLKKAVGHSKLTYEKLLAILIEIEGVINNRPLTYIDGGDFDQLLIPSHIFCGRRTLDPPVRANDGSLIDPNCQEVVRRIKKLNSIIIII